MNGEDFTNYKVDEKVVYVRYCGANCSTHYCGVITKVNKAFITFSPYQLSGRTESNNPNGECQDIKYFYDKTSFDKSVRTNIYTSL